MIIPSMLLKKLYTLGSLKNAQDGVQFAVKNRLSDVELVGLRKIAVDGKEAPLDSLRLTLGDGRVLTPSQITSAAPLAFPLRSSITVQTKLSPLAKGKHELEIAFEAKGFGKIQFKVEDSISDQVKGGVRIPRDENDDYAPGVIKQRQQLVESFAGVKLDHLAKYSFDPHIGKGNIEHFVGVAQIPIGLAGPVRINGEHAQGDFLIPLATTEGTLVASYNRGIKIMNLSGGITTTIVGDAMQRAPVFVFGNARQAREFVAWVNDNFAVIKEQADGTSSVARLQDIDSYLSNKFAFLRFNYKTGDAAGQNMVGRATFAACSWIIDNYAGITNFYLESNFATDKKASWINIARTRGKRVTAEATVKRDVLIEHMRVEPEKLFYHYGVANIGGFMSGVNNNGAHSANGITAMFIATGQDVANVSESSAGMVYCELTKDGDLYMSITIPSLIVATYGGGTGLATQKECLSILDCVGKGKVNKLAEIVAAVALAGEISLAAAISSSDWVSSHEKYGRNR
ncbi:MAG: hydroxymethylglutaryl-CoA reductase [Anaerolineae bacterium]|nr:hydroxymethylglutaryl-CoA reductase [Anaerolineae bacterium]